MSTSSIGIAGSQRAVPKPTQTKTHVLPTTLTPSGKQYHRILRSFVALAVVMLICATLMVTVLVKYPQRVDRFLNSDQQPLIKHVASR